MLCQIPRMRCRPYNNPLISQVLHRIWTLTWFTALSLCFTAAWLGLGHSQAQLAELLPSNRRMHIMSPNSAASWGDLRSTVWTVLQVLRITPEADVRGTLGAIGLFVVLFLGPIVHGVWSGLEASSPVLLGPVAGASSDNDDDEASGDEQAPLSLSGAGRRSRAGRCSPCGSACSSACASVLSNLSDYDDALHCPPTHDADRQALIVRDLVAAPLLEELLFRCAMGSVVLASGAPAWLAVWLAPLAFAGAHLHLGVSEWRGGMPMGQAVSTALFRTTYTLLFGRMAMGLWLQGPTVASAVTAHVVCNWLGAPDARGFALLWHDALSPAATRWYAVGRAVVVSCAYVGGVAGFALLSEPIGEWIASGGARSSLHVA
jgi:hypothetical protein